ncbi:PEP-CTERM system TPR-repeat protein PrsT [Aliiglaciecola sp. CAU 1673]|uniref:XrtA/PEP-CTERM system TPR-repeat protein PrsT n=1 Tax=Aliiglaciecola sp. CAU 1673 TaxID=3032595 RepID=UPI0023DC4A57|nr:XrtA/PEP-CTERM system TPR-repeat protein PrsT [Aliiglaciecola sp. CAU 1673]MDF2179020.1 PEP-CTERM system TPR-repeat protein PrsT [Aliiglaciecola sp. CAU 1673]
MVFRVTLTALLVCSVLACSKPTSEQHLQQAREFIEKGNKEAATIELKNALQLTPQLAEARFELGKLYLDLRLYAEAEKELDRAMEYGYPKKEVIPLLSRAYQRTGSDLALSKLATKDTGMSDSESAEVDFYKLESFVNLDQKHSARQIIEQIKQYRTNSPFKTLALAYGYLLDDQRESALIQLDEVLKAHPNQPNALSMKANLLFQQRDLAGAADVYKQYHESHPEEHEVTFILAKLLTDLGRTEEAEPLLDSLLKLNKENSLLNQLKGVARAKAEDHAKALEFSQKALQERGSDPALRLVAGYAAFQLKDYQTAYNHLSYIAGDLPPDHPGMRLLAASQLQLGMDTQAGETLNQMQNLSAEDASLLSVASFNLLRQGDVKQAKALVEKSSTVSQSAEDLTRLGILQLSLNDVEGVLNLEKALEQAPDQALTKATLATAYIATGQFEKALKLAEEWQNNDENAAQGYLLAGNAHMRMGNQDKARQSFEALLAKQPDNSQAKLALVEVDLVQGNAEQAKAALGALLVQSPTFLPALIRNFEMGLREGSGKQAIAPIQKAFDAKPDDMQTRLLLAKARLVINEPAKTIELLKGQSNPSSLPNIYWETLGQAYLATNQVAEAEKHFDQWLSFAPKQLSAQVGKLLLLDIRSQFSEGLTKSQEALAMYPDDVRVRVLHTHFLLMNADFDKARKAFDVLPAAFKNSKMGKSFEGRLLAGEDNCPAALPSAQEAYQATPNHRNLTVLVFCLEKTGQQPQSLALLKQHMAQHDKDLPSLMLLAEREVMVAPKDAISHYEQALALHQDNFLALNNLAYLYAQEGRLEPALKHAERANALKPDHPAVMDTLAQIYTKRDNPKQAEELLARAVTLPGSTEEIYLNYVELLLQQGKKELAQRRLEQKSFEQAASLSRVSALKKQYSL